jgi:hypothetical protein
MTEKPGDGPERMRENAGVVSDALDKGRDAVHAMGELSDNFIDAFDEPIKSRPYATLALVTAAPRLRRRVTARLT